MAQANTRKPSVKKGTPATPAKGSTPATANPAPTNPVQMVSPMANPNAGAKRYAAAWAQVYAGAQAAQATVAPGASVPRSVWLVHVAATISAANNVINTKLTPQQWATVCLNSAAKRKYLTITRP